MALPAIVNLGDKKKGPNLPVCLFLLQIQIEIEKSGVKDLKLEVCMYVEKRWSEFLMVLSITNFGILCLFFYIISISVSSVELQDL